MKFYLPLLSAERRQLGQKQAMAGVLRALVLSVPPFPPNLTLGIWLHLL